MVKNVRKISDEIYATYEMTVRAVDTQCSPMEETGISHKSLHDIVNFIKEINESASDIRNDFALEIDAISKTDVGSLSYTASIEAQAIQKKWELKYSLHVESDEEKQERENEKDETRAQQREQEEKEQLLKKQQEEKEQEEKRQLEREVQEWERDVERIKKRKEDKETSEYRKLEESYAKREMDLREENERLCNSIMLEVERLEGKKAECQKELIELGWYHVFRKKELKERLEKIENQLIECETKKQTALSSLRKELADLRAEKQTQKKTIQQKLDEMFVIPKNPRQIYQEKQEAMRKKKDREQKEGIYRAIIEVIDQYPMGCLTSEIMSDKRFHSYSFGQMTRLLNELKEDGRVAEYRRNMRTYFVAN